MRIKPSLVPLALLAFISSGLAKAPDLTRETPVPADEPIPVVDFFRPALLTDARLSPSGTHVAALISVDEDRHVLLVYDIATGKMAPVGGSGDRDVYRFDWLDDQRLVFNLSAEKLYELGLFAADVDRLDQPYPVLQYCLASFLGAPETSPDQPLIWMRREVETNRDGGVVEVNTAVKTGRFIDMRAAGATHSDYANVRDQNDRCVLKTYPKPSGGLTTRYICDQDRALAFAITSDDGVQTLNRLEGGEWRKCPVNLDDIEVISYGEHPGELVVRGPRQPGKPRALQFMDAATGKLGDVLLQDPEYDFEGELYRDPTTHLIIGVSYQRNGPRTIWFDSGMAAVQKVLDGMFPGQIVRVVSLSKTPGRFVIARFSDRQPAIYDRVDLKTHQVATFKHSRPWIDAKRMRPMEIMRYKTVDGRVLDAYLTLPAGATPAHPAPLIVLPHGGPYLRDNWSFHPEVQFLASRGYAVLQPNYRGSTGYDWKFPEEDRWDFVKMHEDVTAATKAALNTKRCDPQRVAIMGGSFGGYLAICAAVDEGSSLYRCAVSIDGVFDWGQMASQLKYYQFDNPQYGWMMRRLGNPRENQAKFDAISPLRRADKIRIPVFVAHGKEDRVVEIGQSRDLVAALERNHVPHEVMFAGGEGHGMAHLDDRLELYTRIEAFLQKYLMADPNTVAAK